MISDKFVADDFPVAFVVSSDWAELEEEPPSW